MEKALEIQFDKARNAPVDKRGALRIEIPRFPGLPELARFFGTRDNGVIYDS